MAIACISAFPAMINPGMVSCDLALHSVLTRLGIETRVDRFNFEQTRQIGSIESRYLRDIGDLSDYAAILFWGDFQHFANYARLDLTRRQRARTRGRMDAPRFFKTYVERAFLLGRTDLQRKTILFGETVYGMSAADLAIPGFAAACTNLFARAAHIQFRDPLSVALAQQLAPTARIRFGCDCAFMLDADSTLPMEAAKAGMADLPARYVACALGRSGENRRLGEFAGNLARRHGVELVTFDWLKPPPSAPLAAIARNIAIVRGADFVVTDIYHLIVTTLREGRPVVGLGWGASRGRTTLDDKKKELLLRSYFGRQFYTFIEDVIENEGKAMQNALLAVRSEMEVGLVARSCRQHRTMSERRLSVVLKRLLKDEAAKKSTPGAV